MARRTRTRTRTTTTVSTRKGGSGLARYLLPLGALGVAAYLLWPKKASAAPALPRPVGPAITPPAPPPAGTTVALEPVADAALTPGTGRGRIKGSNVRVRQAPNTTSATLSLLPLGAGVAVPVGSPYPDGWIPVTTARGVQGYVSAQYVDLDGNAPGGFSSASATPTSSAGVHYLYRR